MAPRRERRRGTGPRGSSVVMLRWSARLVLDTDMELLVADQGTHRVIMAQGTAGPSRCASETGGRACTDAHGALPGGKSGEEGPVCVPADRRVAIGGDGREGGRWGRRRCADERMCCPIWGWSSLSSLLGTGSGRHAASCLLRCCL
jgi:hypothetical protein